LRDLALAVKQVRRRLAVGPDALLQCPLELRMVRVAHEAAGLMVEGGVEEEAIVLDLEMAVLLADSPLAEREELLAFGEGAHGDGPFFESDRHRSEGVGPLPGDSRRNCNRSNRQRRYKRTAGRDASL